MTDVNVVSPADAPRAAAPGHYDAFISYSRRDVAFAADWLCEELRAQGKQVWLDLDITGGAKWRDRVRRGIEACKSLVFVVSPASVASEACLEELEDAVALHKLVIPVIHEDVPERLMPQALTEFEWVFLRGSDDRTAGMRRLLDALEADLEWRDQHTRLAGRAREWLDSSRNSSYLLRGADLREAEAWLAHQAGHRTAPTREQAEYITHSRQAAGRRMYGLIGSLATGLAIAIALAIFALIQRHTAIEQTHVAQSRLLASQATSTGDLELASLMAVEAYRLSPTFEARSAILTVADSHESGAPLTGNEGGVNSVAFSPNGALLASASDDGTVRIWNVATRRQILPWLRPLLTGPSDRILSVAFSPNGRVLAAGTLDGHVWLWSVATHQPIGPPIADRSGVKAVGFSPDGRTLAAGLVNGSIQLWDAISHRAIGAKLAGHAGSVNAVAFSPDGKMLASGSSDGIAAVWRIQAGVLAETPFNPHAGSINSVAFSPNGRLLASACNDGAIRLSDPASGVQLGKPFVGHTNFVLSVAFSPDGKTLASGSYDHSIRLWNVSTHTEIGSPLTGHDDYVSSVAFSPDGSMVASGSGDFTIRLWRVAPSRQIGTPFTGHRDYVDSVAFGLGGKVLASGSDDGSIRLWSVASHRQISELKPGAGPVTGIAFSPDGKTLAAGSEDGTLRTWDFTTRRETALTTAEVPVLFHIAYSQRGNRLAFAETFLTGPRKGSGLIGIINTSTYTAVGALIPGEGAVAISPDGKTLATPGIGTPADHTIRLLDAVTHRQIGAPLAGHANPVSTVAFSPDGKLLASGSADNTIRFWNVATHRQVGAPLTGHSGTINQVAFSSDGLTLASASDDGSIRLWSIGSRRELGSPLTGGTRPVDTVAFSPDGRTLASGSEDRLIRLWATYPVATYIHQLCGYINVNHVRQLWQQANLSVPYERLC